MDLQRTIQPQFPPRQTVVFSRDLDEEARRAFEGSDCRIIDTETAVCAQWSALMEMQEAA
jgi:hypothetical protein